jgi:NAD(P)-dependent dehydrogenase (short-subunit alcohol dehydrogenase family)
MARTILITGASRGIGRASAIAAGRLGWSVGVNYAGNRAAAESVVAAVGAAGGRAVALKGDVASEAEVLAMFEGMAALGPLDGVVVNAGIVAPAQTLAEMSAERIRRVLDVNLFGALLCAREAARRLSRRRGGKGGSIVFVSSIAATLGAPNEYVDYAAAKGALDTLTRGLAKELGPEGVRVNAVRPGIIDTEIHASGGRPERVAQIGATAPLGRAGTAEEVAAAILWLLGDGASYVSGAILDVGGGR